MFLSVPMAGPPVPLWGAEPVTPPGVWLADLPEPDFSSGLDSQVLNEAVEGVPDHVLGAGQDIPEGQALRRGAVPESGFDLVRLPTLEGLQLQRRTCTAGNESRSGRTGKGLGGRSRRGLQWRSEQVPQGRFGLGWDDSVSECAERLDPGQPWDVTHPTVWEAHHPLDEARR